MASREDNGQPAVFGKGRESFVIPPFTLVSQIKNAPQTHLIVHSHFLPLQFSEPLSGKEYLMDFVEVAHVTLLLRERGSSTCQNPIEILHFLLKLRNSPSGLGKFTHTWIPCSRASMRRVMLPGWTSRSKHSEWWLSGNQVVKNLPAVQETQVWSLGQEDLLEKGHSSIFAWEIPMDRGAWQVTVLEVTKSRTQLSDFTTQGHFQSKIYLHFMKCFLLKFSTRSKNSYYCANKSMKKSGRCF